MIRFKTGKLRSLYGDVPLYSSGPNKGNINRKELSASLGISVNDLKKAYFNWQDIFRIEGSSLTFSEYLSKMGVLGLHPSQIGNGQGQFNLSRDNDEGAYHIHNCEFKPRLVNAKEQKHPPLSALVREQMRGEGNPNAALTNAQARLIRSLHATGASMRSIARQFDVSHPTISHIVNERRYKTI